MRCDLRRQELRDSIWIDDEVNDLFEREKHVTWGSAAPRLAHVFAPRVLDVHAILSSCGREMRCEMRRVDEERIRRFTRPQRSDDVAAGDASRVKPQIVSARVVKGEIIVVFRRVPHFDDGAARAAEGAPGSAFAA